MEVSLGMNGLGAMDRFSPAHRKEKALFLWSQGLFLPESFA
jgi:hypothetical protein